MSVRDTPGYREAANSIRIQTDYIGNVLRDMNIAQATVLGNVLHALLRVTANQQQMLEILAMKLDEMEIRS